jgi:GH24 family phage-related lysozyme (muramidase)
MIHPKLSLLVAVDLTPQQWEALSSWAQDVWLNAVQGPESSVEHSVLLSNLNQRNFQIAAAEFSKWIIVNGKPSLKMLSKRRAEQALFRNASNATDPSLHTWPIQTSC